VLLFWRASVGKSKEEVALFSQLWSGHAELCPAAVTWNWKGWFAGTRQAFAESCLLFSSAFSVWSASR